MVGLGKPKQIWRMGKLQRVEYVIFKCKRKKMKQMN